MDYAGYYVHLITAALKSLTWWCLTVGGNIVSVILFRNCLSLLWIFSTEIVTLKVSGNNPMKPFISQEREQTGVALTQWRFNLWGLFLKIVVQLAIFQVTSWYITVCHVFMYNTSFFNQYCIVLIFDGDLSLCVLIFHKILCHMT